MRLSSWKLLLFPGLLLSICGIAQTSGFDYPLDSCFTYTYFLHISNATGDVRINDAFTAADGTTYLAGSVGGGGQTDGLLQQLDHTGSIAWSKAIGQAGRNEAISSIKQLSTGHLVVVGTSTFPDGTDTHMFMAEVDAGGALVWAKTLSGLQGYKGVDIAPTSYKGIGFAGNDDSTLVFGKLNYDGTLAWARRLRLMEKGVVTGMVWDDQDSWYIAYSGVDSSRRVGALLHILSASGDIDRMTRFGGPSADADFIFHDLQFTNLRPKLTGISATDSSPYRLFRTSIKAPGTIEDMQTFDMPGLLIDSSAQSRLSPWADVIAFRPNASDGNLYTLKTVNEAYHDTLIHWRRQFSGVGPLQLAAVEQTFDGGFLVAGTLTGGPLRSVQVLKTDSLGVVKDCPGTDFPFSSTLRRWPPTPKVNPTATTVAATMSAASLASTPLSLPGQYSCRSLTCPTLPAESRCIQTFFRKYRGATHSERGTGLLADIDNEITLVGSARDNPYLPESGKGFMARFDGKGKLLVRKKLTLGRYGSFSRVYRLKDGNLLVLGSSGYRHPNAVYDTSYITISKFTPGFDLVWNSSFPIYGPGSAAYGLVEGDDGSIYLHYVESASFCKDLGILKLNSTGVLQWAKKFVPGNGCVQASVGSLTQDATHLYIISYAPGPGVVLMKVSKSTGAVAWAKGYDVPDATMTNLANNLSFIGGNLVVNGLAYLTTGMGRSSHEVVMILDTEGNIKRTRQFITGNVFDPEMDMTVTRNQELVLTSANNIYSHFLRLDSNLNIVNTKRVRTDWSVSLAVSESADGSLYETGYYFDTDPYKGDLVLKKFSPDGLLGSCAVDTIVYNQMGAQAIKESVVRLSEKPSPVVMTVLPLEQQSSSLQENALLCSAESPCTDLKLSGPAAVCDALPRVLTVRRNAECHTPVLFAYNNQHFKVVARTDTTLTVQAVQAGTTEFRARIFTGCRWIEDSLTVASTPSPVGALSLGPDTVLCPGNTLVLNARKGYASYRWADGSTDSTFRVSQPGTYFAETADACGGTYRDTVVVSAAPPIALDAGPDRVKCNQDTLQLHAPAGFLNYRWSNNYNLSSATAQSVVVNPLVDTAYFLVAEKTPGCFAYDTVRVKAYISPAIRLGTDTAFCSGQAITLDAGSGFASYAWSTGASAQVIAVGDKGSYSVTGTTAEGCRSADTLVVRAVHPLPAVNLGPDNTLCTGAERLLDAGAFAHYLWQDGSTGRRLAIKELGTYSVTVTDNNGCTASDTLVVDRLLALPKDFLPADTVLCSYGTVVLKPSGSFTRYVWNTGASSSTLTIDQPGLYTLVATDAHGCVGKDEVLVHPEECQKGLYVPTAFTPNKDGRNDQFRALLFGAVKEFRFTIYNRWGEVVFQTNDRFKGWDGSYKGRLQDANVFVWTCRYQLEGEEVKIEKGTVMLIR